MSYVQSTLKADFDQLMSDGFVVKNIKKVKGKLRQLKWLKPSPVVNSIVESSITSYSYDELVNFYSFYLLNFSNTDLFALVLEKAEEKEVAQIQNMIKPVISNTLAEIGINPTYETTY